MLWNIPMSTNGLMVICTNASSDGLGSGHFKASPASRTPLSSRASGPVLNPSVIKNLLLNPVFRSTQANQELTRRLDSEF